MMKTLRGGSVETVASGFPRPEEPDWYIQEHATTYFVHAENDERERHPIGKLEWMRVCLGKAINDQQNWWEIFDAHSQDLEALHGMVFRRDGEPRAPFNEWCSDLYYIHGFELLDAEYDAKQVAEEIVEYVMWAFSDAGLFTYFHGPRDSDALLKALVSRGFDRYFPRSSHAPFYALWGALVRPPLPPYADEDEDAAEEVAETNDASTTP